MEKSHQSIFLVCIEANRCNAGQFNATHLFELVNDHGECLKDGSGRSCQGDDPLGAVALGDVDASPALRRRK